MNILLKAENNYIPVAETTVLNSLWFWIAIIELLLIVLLIYRLKSKKKRDHLSDIEARSIINSKNSSIDMDNLINSIHNSKTLYKELSKKCHPDRFINDPKQKIAEEIFQDITKNERNFEKLTSLKSRAITELNVTF